MQKECVFLVVIVVVYVCLFIYQYHPCPTHKTVAHHGCVGRYCQHACRNQK